MKKAKSNSPRKSAGYGNGIGMVAAVAFFLLLCRSDVAIEYMKKGLELCARTVIPSLFPFMVISELMVSSGVGRRAISLFSKPMHALFGVSENGAYAAILGAVCGFPIGTAVLCAMRDKGSITERELSRVMTFCNNPGSAFVISAVGVSLFGSRRLGITLYICVLLSAVTVGVVGRFFFGGGEESASASNPVTEGAVGPDLLACAVRRSATAMLTVCAFVAFFSSFVGCIGSIVEKSGLSGAAVAAIFGFFEISGGVGMAAEAGNSSVAVLLCAWTLGWSGLSVHLQLMALCGDRKVSFKPYFLAKAAQGILCALYAGIAMRLPFLSEAVFAPAARTYGFGRASAVACLFFAASVFPLALFCRFKVKKDAKSEDFEA